MPKPNRGKKIRTEFRKRYDDRTRKTDFTRDYRDSESFDEQLTSQERVSGKGSLTRKRTVMGDQVGEGEETGVDVRRSLGVDECLTGRVLSVHGLSCVVLSDEGERLSCAVRGVLKRLHTDSRHVVVAGDIVQVSRAGEGEGVIERVEPRYGTLSRTSRGKQHLMVANVDQVLIVGSAREPHLKPGLIDRMVIAAEVNQIEPVICINKIDLLDPAQLQPLLGVYGQMGYQVLCVSAKTGQGVAQLQRLTQGMQTVVAGQSGVGKSSLLNALEPDLNLRVAAVSTENQKGKHTTTASKLIPLAHGGYLVDTPGVRQFQLWDILPEELSGLFRDIRPYVNRCRYPDCTHTHEDDCGVKHGVADNELDLRRYESLVHLGQDEHR